MAKENEELKQQREELEVRVNALRSQYEGRLSRQEKELRELRDLREQQERHVEQRDEPVEQGPSKVNFRNLQQMETQHLNIFFIDVSLDTELICHSYAFSHYIYSLSLSLSLSTMLSADQCVVFPDSGATEDYRTEADFSKIHTSG